MTNNNTYSPLVARPCPYLAEAAEHLRKAEDALDRLRNFYRTVADERDLSKSGRAYVKWLETIQFEVADTLDEVCNPPDEV